MEGIHFEEVRDWRERRVGEAQKALVREETTVIKPASQTDLGNLSAIGSGWCSQSAVSVHRIMARHTNSDIRVGRL